MNTSGRACAVSLPAASTNELNRQQKQPPAISSVANPFERNIALSTSLSPWSFVIRPTRSPSAVKRCASFATDVVFPEPRNPPIIMYRAGAGVGVDCGVMVCLPLLVLFLILTLILILIVSWVRLSFLLGQQAIYRLVEQISICIHIHT